MKNLLSLSLHLCMLPAFCNAQIIRHPTTASHFGLTAYSISHTELLSFTVNPAAISQIKNPVICIYSERKFFIDKMNGLIAAFSLPTNSGNFAFKATYDGFNDYNESSLCLAYGRGLGKKLDVGANFNYNIIRIATYGSAAAISFALGVIMHVTEKLHFGFSADNPVGGKLNNGNNEKLSSAFSFGIGYDASSQAFISASIEKEENEPVSVNAGIQYKFIPQMQVSGGILSATSSSWIGIEFLINSLQLEISASFHPQLGITPGLMLTWLIHSANNAKKAND